MARNGGLRCQVALISPLLAIQQVAIGKALLLRYGSNLCETTVVSLLVASYFEHSNNMIDSSQNRVPYNIFFLLDDA